ncbi:MoaD/ThiS family protein [Desulfobacula sp.]
MKKCKLKTMIKIDLKLFVTLSKYQPQGSKCLEIPEGTTVEKLIVDLGIPRDIVKLIFINGKSKPIHTILKNKDRLGLFPPVGGG